MITFYFGPPRVELRLAVVAVLIAFSLGVITAVIVHQVQKYQAEVVSPPLAPATQSLVCEHARMMGGWRCGEV